MNWVKNWYFRQIALVVALGLLVIGSVPAQSMAYVVGTESVTAMTMRSADIDTIQRVLESKAVTEKLKDAGLSMDEIKSRLDKLSDAELHQFAVQVDSLYPGGDGLGFVIGVLVIVILVLVILKMTDRKIIIK